MRWPGGLKLWRVTGPGVDLGDKQPYNPELAADRARGHAEHFAHLLAGISALSLALGCDKVPLLAPAFLGSLLLLFANAFAAYATAVSSQYWGASLPLMLLVGIVAGTLLSILMALISLRSSELFFMVATLVAGQLHIRRFICG